LQTITKRYDLSENCVRNWIKQGKLPAVRIGAKVLRVPVKAFEALMKEAK